MPPPPVLRICDPREAAAAALVAESHALMERLFPPESCHPLPLTALAGEDVIFVIAQEAEAQAEAAPCPPVPGALGIGALALRAGYGEIKSMYTAPAARGRGVAALILGRLEAEARARGIPLLRLETGDVLESARRLYARRGFRETGPFGAYEPDPRSVFMEKALG